LNLKVINNFKSNDQLRLRLGGAIIFADGYLDSKTAALQRPYSDDPANMGKMNLSEVELADAVRQALARGLQPTIHAMGDRAIDTALKVIERSSKDVKFRVEQAAVLNPTLIKRLKGQNVVVSSAHIVPTEFKVWKAIEHLGKERAKWCIPQNPSQ
jgi:predicted amidohydrolase YtcJ